jgi:NAD(P)H-quinone oxidoreductase subunit I
MLKFLKQVGDYTKEAFQAGKYIGQGLSVTFDHMRRRPITVQYPYEKLILSERFRGRIHFEFDKCISCEVCVRVCPINLPVVDWEFNKAQTLQYRFWGLHFLRQLRRILSDKLFVDDRRI